MAKRPATPTPSPTPELVDLLAQAPAGQPGPDAGGSPQLLVDPTGGPYGAGEVETTADEPPEDLTIAEILERQGKPVPDDTPPDLRGSIIRDMQIGDAPHGELPPIPEGFSPMASQPALGQPAMTGQPISTPWVPTETPKKQMSYSDFVNSGYDREALQVSKVPPPMKPLDISADGVRFESRIRIAKAWAYDVRGLARAPDYVDRNWLAYDGPDDLRGLPASPVLRVPTADGVTVCRPGDVIVEQEVLLDENRSYREVEVWSREQFERMFIVSPRPAAVEING